MLHTLLTFLPVAVLLSLTPGVTTALVVRNAARGGRRQAFLTTSGNSVGVLAWACFAAVGIAAVVAASAAVFDAVKLAGAALLLVMGLRSLLGRRDADAPTTSGRSAFREGLVTSLANPKLAAFFVALFPQFIPHGAAVLPRALEMAMVIVAVDLIWYSTLALLVARARRAFTDGGWGRRIERLTGAVLIGLGVRLALERR
ncbi:MAG TPA: LysE family translocator [Solirubrobacteraceae bacterium]|nr:LysE family translocator [Solirubrobacteraceae bacterium]